MSTPTAEARRWALTTMPCSASTGGREAACAETAARPSIPARPRAFRKRIACLRLSTGNLMGRSKRDDDVALPQRNFIAVVAFAAPIDDEELGCSLERQQRVVPGAGPVVDALAAVAEESADAFGGERAGWRDNDEEGRGREGDEGLARERMAFHETQTQRKRYRLRAHDADQGPSAGRAHIHRRQVVVAPGRAGIDRIMGPAFGLDDVAEGGEGGGRQRRCHEAQAGHRRRAGHASSPHRRRRLTPPSGWILNLTWLTGPRAAMSFSKR